MTDHNEICVSIIIPIYNVEDYVGKSIESLQAQTFKNWHLYAVIDGSPDNSGAVCEGYAANDDRIEVIYKENGGAHSARNLAIDIATGKYLYFMDGDDWAEPTMLEDMVAIAEKNQSELVISGYYIDTYYNDDEKHVDIKAVDDIVYKSQDEFRFDSYRLFDRNLLYTPWNKLYLRDFIVNNKIYFPKVLWDDFPFNLEVIKNIEKVSVTSQKYYHFIRKREESETSKYNKNLYEKREEEDGWLDTLFNNWNVDTPETQEFMARRYLERLIGCVENLTNPFCELSRKEKIAQVKAMIRTEKVARYSKIVEPKSIYTKILLKPFKWKNTHLAYYEAKVITFVKTRNTKMFANLRSKR